MNKYISTLIILLLAISSYAAPTLQWSIDLSTVVKNDNHSWIFNESIQEFADGSCALLGFGNGGNESLLIILNKDGESIFEIEFSGSAYFSGKGSSSRFYIIVNTEGVPFLRIFERNGDIYTYVDLANVKNIGISGMPSSYGHGAATALYTLSFSEQILSKHIFPNTSASLVASTSGIDNTNYLISWGSEPNVQYQIETSTDLESWNPIGSPIIGTGEPLTWSTALEGSSQFFRVITL